MKQFSWDSMSFQAEVCKVWLLCKRSGHFLLLEFARPATGVGEWERLECSQSWTRKEIRCVDYWSTTTECRGESTALFRPVALDLVVSSEWVPNATRQRKVLIGSLLMELAMLEKCIIESDGDAHGSDYISGSESLRFLEKFWNVHDIFPQV